MFLPKLQHYDYVLLGTQKRMGLNQIQQLYFGICLPLAWCVVTLRFL